MDTRENCLSGAKVANYCPFWLRIGHTAFRGVCPHPVDGASRLWFMAIAGSAIAAASAAKDIAMIWSVFMRV